MGKIPTNGNYKLSGENAQLYSRRSSSLDDIECPVDYNAWETDGFLILRNFYSQKQVDHLNEIVGRVWQSRNMSNSGLTVDAYLETTRYRRMLLSSAADDVRLYPYKINDLYLDSTEIRAFALDKSLRSILTRLLIGEPLICNTLNLEYGSQQPDHIDSDYMRPRKKDKLVVSWISLDEVDLSNGPVRYYPESHKIPRYRHRRGENGNDTSAQQCSRAYLQDQIQSLGIRAREFTAQPGDVLIWHSQLLHGGVPILDSSKRRRSMVVHYFRAKDYWHHFWRVKRAGSGGYYYHREHPEVAES